MTLLIVGLAPARSALPNQLPLVGTDSWKRLARLIGCTEADLTRAYDNYQVRTANLLTRSQLVEDMRPRGKWDEPLNKEVGRDAWKTKIRPRIMHRDHVLCLGLEVARAAGLHSAPIAAWTRRELETEFLQRRWFDIAWMPHPGGTNMAWNDEACHAFRRWIAPTAIMVGLNTSIEPTTT